MKSASTSRCATRALPSGRRFWASALPGLATATALLTIISVAAACGSSNGDNPANGIPATGTVEPTSRTAGGTGSTGPAEATNPPATANPGSRGSGSGSDPTSTPAPQDDTTAGPIPATPTPLPAPTEPLTGEPLDDPSIMDRPALAVKIGTSSVGRPQTGINQADILLEVRVETITRLLAVFHSQGAEPLGPVRSARSSDPDILANFSRPVFGHSGANPGVLREVAQGETVGKLHELRWDDLPTGYWRVRDRVPPFNLYTTTSAIWNAVPSYLQAPEPLFQYREQGDELPPVAEPVPGVEIRYLGGTIAHFVWDAGAGAWARWQDGTPHVDMARNPDGTPDPEADPVQVAPANVVVLQTRYTSSAPCPSCPQAITVDPEGGTALVFTDGHLIRGRWARPSADRPWQVTGNDGNPVRLTPGQTFIALPGGDVLVMVESFAKNLLKSR